MIINLERRGKVHGVRMRIIDGNFHPKCAPADKMSSDLKRKLEPPEPIECLDNWGLYKNKRD